MSIREQEELLFADWRDAWKNYGWADSKPPIFIPDGAVDEDSYLKSRLKLLFVLKEVNGDNEGKGWDLREYLTKGGRRNTWDNITRWVEGIRSIPKEIPWREINDISEEKRIKVLRSIVAVNMKKSAGGHTADGAEIAQVAAQDKKFLKRQFSLYDPDVTICCGTKATYEWLIPDSPLKWDSTARGIRYCKPKEGKYLIEYVHPEARVPDCLKYYGLIDALREILMRHDKAELLLRLVLDLQGSAEGLTLEDIGSRYSDKPLSRRTAERLRDAVDRLVPQLEQANPGEVPKRWRIRGGSVNGLIQPSAQELAALQNAISSLTKRNMTGMAATLRDLERKVAAIIRPDIRSRLAPDVEFLTTVEGMAMQPGPRVAVPEAILLPLRQAILNDRRIRIHYRARTTGSLSKQLLAPYGLLYGIRPYLVAYNYYQKDYRLWSLSNIEQVEETGASFKRDADFNLESYAAKSFGTFQEDPIKVVWRFKPEVAADAKQFLFHPNQDMQTEEDGSLLVSFTAGGLTEMCWHLFTWGDAVEIVAPASLRQRMKSLLSASMKPLDSGGRRKVAAKGKKRKAK